MYSFHKENIIENGPFVLYMPHYFWPLVMCTVYALCLPHQINTSIATTTPRIRKYSTSRGHKGFDGKK